MLNYANYSNNELFRISGTLPLDRIELLLSHGDIAERLDNVLSSTQEASNCYMQEDFLSDQLHALQSILKCLRGENKLRLDKVIEEIARDISIQVNESEYGKDILRNILKD